MFKVMSITIVVLIVIFILLFRSMDQRFEHMKETKKSVLDGIEAAIVSWYLFLDTIAISKKEEKKIIQELTFAFDYLVTKVPDLNRANRIMDEYEVAEIWDCNFGRIIFLKYNQTSYMLNLACILEYAYMKKDRAYLKVIK